MAFNYTIRSEQSYLELEARAGKEPLKCNVTQYLRGGRVSDFPEKKL